MPTVEELEGRVAKLEKRSAWRFVFQYLLAPLILVVFGFYFNWVLQETRSDVKRIEIAQEIVTDALADDYEKSFITLRFLPIVLDAELAAELERSIIDYWAKRAAQQLSGNRPEEAVAILEAAERAGSDVAERVEMELRGSDVVAAVPERLDNAREAERLTAEGFSFLADGRYREALHAFTAVEEVYPTYGAASEIGEVLRENLGQMRNVEKEREVLGMIAEQYSWKAPIGSIAEIERRIGQR